jgi:hypothetical protein
VNCGLSSVDHQLFGTLLALFIHYHSFDCRNRPCEE